LTAGDNRYDNAEAIPLGPRGSAEDIHPSDSQRTDSDVERTQMTGSEKVLKRLRSADLGFQ